MEAEVPGEANALTAVREAGSVPASLDPSDSALGGREAIVLTAFHGDVERAREVGRGLGAHATGQGVHVDTYLEVPNGILTLRETPGAQDSVIYYRRQERLTPMGGESESVSVGPGRAAPIGELFAHAGATQAVVRIERETWTSGPARIHLDDVEGLGSLVHFDVDVLEAGGVDPARRAVLELAGAFGVTAADEVPWSYAELRAMYQAASGWRARLARARRRGTLFVLDGASGSGKSTLARNLAADADLNLHLARRYSTRRRRAGDARAEYVFVSRRAFAKAAISGRLIEYRHYRFGMSYGLPWHGAVTPLLGGRDSLGIVSLGSVAHVKRVFPEAVAVLVDAPIETIRRRLIRRGLNNQEEIDERLGNAAATEHFREHYDHIVMNDDGMLEQAEASLKEFIASRSRAEGSNS